MKIYILILHTDTVLRREVWWSTTVEIASSSAPYSRLRDRELQPLQRQKYNGERRVHDLEDSVLEWCSPIQVRSMLWYQMVCFLWLWH